MRQLLALFLLCLSSMYSRGASADGLPLVHFAGFSLLGNFSDNHRDFPYSENLLAEKSASGLPFLNEVLLARLGGRQFDNFRLDTGYGNYKKGDGLVLAFVLTWENVSKEHFDSFTKVSVDLHGEALLFDFVSMEIISAYPFGIQYIDSMQGDPTHEKIQEIVRALYLSKDASIFHEFADTLPRVRPKYIDGTRIQVADAKIQAPAHQMLAAASISDSQARALLISSFERFLSKNAGIPIVPHAVGQAIGNTMAVRLANGDVYNLKLPLADYQIHLDLTNVRKIKVGESAAEVAWAYASYLAVNVEQPLSGKKYLIASFKFPVVKKIAIGNGRPDDRSGFQESLFSVSDQITRQLKTPDNEWIEKWAIGDGVSDQLDVLWKVLDRR